MKAVGVLACLFCVLASFPLAQQSPPAKDVPASAHDFSGMYSFLREGEFVQITLEDAGQLTGFVSRYGDSESDRGVFLDQFFKLGRIDGKKLSFTTETVHGVWYEFKGVVEPGLGKKPGEEGSWILKGELLESRTDADKKVLTKSRKVTFTSFPQDLESAPPRKD